MNGPMFGAWGVYVGLKLLLFCKIIFLSDILGIFQLEFVLILKLSIHSVCFTSICIGGNFEWLVYEWVPFFWVQVYEWGEFWNVGPHVRAKMTPQSRDNFFVEK